MKKLLALLFVLAACSDSHPDSSSSVPSIAEKAESLRDELIAIRRDIHRHPELSTSEARTAGVIQEQLRSVGAEVREGVGGHGVIGIIRGDRPGPVVGYRADMDAMPNQEPEGRPYGSTVPNVFHICGHDLHVAIGIGVAKVLASRRSQMQGTAVFFFQPAEETLQGAKAMIADGALTNPRPEEMYALHVWPFPVGTIAKGAVLAGNDMFTIKLEGESAKPGVIDPLKARLARLGTVQFPKTPDELKQDLVDFQTPNGPLARFVVLSALMSSIQGTQTVLRGIIRASSDAMYPELRTTIKGIVEEMVPPDTYQLSFANAPFPSMVSDSNVVASTTAALEKSVGADKVLSLHAMWPFNGEDFALFIREIPGAMFLLGVANPEKGILGAPHFPDFDADEDAIVIGTRTMSEVVWQRMSRKND